MQPHRLPCTPASRQSDSFTHTAWGRFEIGALQETPSPLQTKHMSLHKSRGEAVRKAETTAVCSCEGRPGLLLGAEGSRTWWSGHPCEHGSSPYNLVMNSDGYKSLCYCEASESITGLISEGQ